MIRRVALPIAALVLVMVGTLLIAPGLSRYTLDVGTTLLIYLVAVQAWNMLAGFSGQFSLGVSAFLGTGAYTTALLAIHAGAAPVLTIPGAALGAAVLALLLAPALLRLRGDYFTIGSLAAALALQAWAVNASVVGGSAGLDLPIDQLPDGLTLFRWAAGVATLTAVVAVVVRHSPFGLRLLAVRENPDAATGLGVDVFRQRLGVLVLSSALTGLAGSIVALQQVHLEPTGTLGLSWSIDVILMTVIGGVGTLVGPAVGTVLVYYGLTKQLAGAPVLGLVLEGLILIAVVRFTPRGLWPTAVDLLRRAVPGRSGRPPERPAERPAPEPSVPGSSERGGRTEDD